MPTPDLGNGLLNMATIAAEQSDPLMPMSELSGEAQAVSNTLLYALVHVVVGRLAAILKGIPGHHSLDGSRHIVAHCEPRNPLRAVGMLHQPLQLTFRTTSLVDWERGWLVWEAEVRLGSDLTEAALLLDESN